MKKQQLSSIQETNRIKILKLIDGYKCYTAVLFIVFLAVACAETLGLSLFLPLFSNILGDGKQLGRYNEFFEVLSGLIPGENKTVGILLLLSVIFFIKSLLLIANNGMNTHFAMKLRESWSHKILATYMGAKYKYLMNEKHGIMLHNANLEPFRVSKSIIEILQMISKIIVFIAIFVMLSWVNLKATLVLTIIGVLLLFIVNKFTLKYSLRFGKKRLEISQTAANIASESLSATKEIKMIGKQDHYLSLFIQELKIFTRVQTRFTIFNQLPDNLLEFIFICIISVIIIYIETSSQFKTNDLLPVIGFYIIVGQKLFKYITIIVAQRMRIVSALPSLKMIYELIHTDVPLENLFEGENIDNINGDIIIRNLNFSYTPTNPVLKNINLKIDKNKMTAIIGPSGSGKSTIADILMRLLEPQSGEVTFNGKNISGFKLNAWRNKIGYVSQEPFLFNSTIKENILIGRESATEHDIINAAKVANIHEFIISLSKGYDTLVGDRGIKLSGGQKQRIVIARVVIRNPDLFIFDEATSALDKKSEAEVQESINNLIGNKTILIIAHRLSTIEKAHMVYDLSEINSPANA